MELNLDIARDNYIKLKCKQNDDVSLLINMYNNGSKYDLEGYLVILNVLRSNNTFIKQTSNIIISGNTLLIGCTRDVTRVAGLAKAELVINKNNKQTTTFNININVIPSVITDNAEASKNVVSVIEELDNKIAQGKEIVAEVDRKKTEAIDTVNILKNDTITSVTELKNTTITQLNNTKKDVEALKQQTITESTNIKDSAIKELSKIKTDSITELNNIKQSSIKELNSIRDTANTDLNKIKKDTIDTVNNAVNKAIEEINKYNIKEVNEKIDNHIADKNLHVTKELKDSITKNATDLERVINNIVNPNLLINGDFQVWQRGERFDGLGSGWGYTADRWAVGTNSDIDIISKYECGIKLTSAANEKYWLSQPIELNPILISQLSGKRVTLSFFIKSDNPFVAKASYSAINSLFSDDSKSIQYNITTEYTKQIFTFTMPNLKYTDTHISILPFRIDSSIQAQLPTTSIYIKQVKLELGDNATTFALRTYAEELALCQRYYEKSSEGELGIWGDCIKSVYIKGEQFKVEKRIVPTLKIYSENGIEGKIFSVYDTSRTLLNAIPTMVSTNGFRQILVENSSAPDSFGYSYTADAEL